MMAAVRGSMKARTGRTIEEWVAVVKTDGPNVLDQKGVRRWLKDEHGIAQNSQWAIAEAAARAAGWSPPPIDEYIAQQYEGPKAHLRPIFDRLREIIEAFGDDVHAEGRATYTPFVRRRQFAAVAAATRGRVDVGLRFTDPPASALLTAGGAPGQGTHKLSLADPQEITDEVERLLRAAYDQNG
jgi:predicted transport protein